MALPADSARRLRLRPSLALGGVTISLLLSWLSLLFVLMIPLPTAHAQSPDCEPSVLPGCPLEFGLAAAASIATADGVHTFVLRLPSPSRVRLRLTNVAAGHDFRVDRAYGENVAVRVYPDETPVEEVLEPDVYIVSVFRVTEQADEPGYSLLATIDGPVVTNVQPGEQVAHSITLLGEYPPRLQDDVWVLVQPAVNGLFYPQSLGPCRDDRTPKRTPKRDGKWQMRIGLGNPESVGEDFTIWVTVAIPAASEALAAMLEEWCLKREFPGLLALPPGVTVHQSIAVQRSLDPNELWGRPANVSNAQLPGTVTIDSIAEGAHVPPDPPAIVVRGSYTPEEVGPIWLLIYPTNGRWYPQSENGCVDRHTRKANGQWQVPATLGGQRPGEPFDLVVVAADSGANADLARLAKQWCEARDHPGLLTVELPQGIEEKGRVRVYRAAAPPPTPAPPTPTPPPSPRPTITNVKSGDRVAQNITVLGEYPADLRDDIWVFVEAPSGSGRLWPQSPNVCAGEGTPKAEGRWEAWVRFGGPEHAGQSFTLVLATVDAQGKQGLLQAWCPEGKAPGLVRLPAGATEVPGGRVDVTRTADLQGPAPKISNAQLPGTVAITNLREGSRVPQSTPITGSYSTDATDATWVLVQVNGRWYPQSNDACRGAHLRKGGGTWEVQAGFGGPANVGEAFDIVVVQATAVAHAFLDQTQQQWCRDTRSPGLLTIQLPQGLSEKSRIRVIRG